MVQIYILGIFTQSSWIWPLSAISVLCVILLAAICIPADLTPFTRGANDNASALNGYPLRVKGGNTEMADALRRGIPALTIFGMTRQNIAPYWHQIGDTIDKIDSQALERNYAFAWHFIQALDESGGNN